VIIVPFLQYHGISKVATMAPVVIQEAGGPESLKLQQWPKPVASIGQVLIRVKAFGLNRSEMFTQQ
jgi:NADPH:quinone reductase-like Zn-dependent oxidoreductase